MGILLRNWHLKLSAVLLATVLYTGIVFSGAFDEATIQVRIEQVNQPPNSYVLTGDLGFVQVRYQAAQELLDPRIVHLSAAGDAAFEMGEVRDGSQCQMPNDECRIEFRI